MVVPACNFYHFLVSFASPASPEDIHKELAREREIKTIESDVKTEKTEEYKKKERQREHAVIGEPI